MKIAVAKESRQREQRVSITPSLAGELRAMGWEVVVESGAGEAAGFHDADYQQHGARIATDKSELYHRAGLVSWFKRPAHEAEELAWVPDRALLIGFLDPLKPGGHAQRYREKDLTTFSWELPPRDATTQAMDAMARMSRLAGEVAYRQHGMRAITAMAAHTP